MSSRNRTMYKLEDNVLVEIRMVQACRKFLIRYCNPKTVYVICFSFLFATLIFNANSPIPNADLEKEINSHEFSPSAENLSLRLSYYSNWIDSLTPINSGDQISGDNIILNASWYPSDLSNRTLIEVNATAIPTMISNENNNSFVEINTRRIGNNATCMINVTTWLLNGTPISEVVSDVFIGNFFIPQIVVLSPNGGESWTGQNNITWTAWDENIQELLTFEVLISSNAGSTFQLITAGINQTWYEWDCSIFEHLDTYVVQVRVLDGIYANSDESDGLLTAGEIILTTSPTTPTSSTTDTNTTTSTTISDLTVLTFVAAAIMSAAILSLIVYYQAKRQF